MFSYLQSVEKDGFFIEPLSNITEHSSSEDIINEIFQYTRNHKKYHLSFVTKEYPIIFYLEKSLYQAALTKHNTVKPSSEKNEDFLIFCMKI